MEGDTTFIFVTEGIESALDRARDAAGEADITVIGGAKAIQQYLDAGLVDELEISISPRLLGGGERLLDTLDGPDIKLEQLAAVEGVGVTHIAYRVVKD
jgi:dihydrofolate reductase